MPSFRFAARLDLRDARVLLVRCDGHDGARPPQAEQVESDRVWVIVAGRFAWRDRSGRAVADPTTALLLRAGEPFEIRHPHGGGDVCLSLGGAIAARVVDRVGPGPRALPLPAFLQWTTLAARLRGGEPIDSLELEETLCTTIRSDSPGAPGRWRDCDIAETIAHELHLHADEPAPLAVLAAAAGVSVFHACRAFRRARGTSIHQHRKALRLRHALALLLDTTWPLARVAADCGYANQAHMSTDFRRLMGVTPRAARAGGIGAVHVDPTGA